MGWGDERETCYVVLMRRRVGERHTDDGEMRESQGEGNGDGRDGRWGWVEAGETGETEAINRRDSR